MILIFGASGTLGSALCSKLAQHGEHIKAVTRHPEKFNKKANPLVEVVYGDLTEPETYIKLLNGADMVIACAHSLMGKGKNDSFVVDNKGHKILIDNCAKKGIKYFIYTSMYGASAESKVDFIRTKYEVEQHLAKSNLKYAIVRPTAFMELHAHELIGKSVLKKGKVKIFGHGKNFFNYVAVNDVAELLVNISVQKPENKIIEIGSPTNITRIELAKLYGEYSGKQPRISHISPKRLRTLSRIIKPFHKGVSRIMNMSAALDEMDYSYDLRQNADSIPFKPKTINSFVEEQARMYLN